MGSHLFIRNHCFCVNTSVAQNVLYRKLVWGCRAQFWLTMQRRKKRQKYLGLLGANDINPPLCDGRHHHRWRARQMVEDCPCPICTCSLSRIPCHTCIDARYNIYVQKIYRSGNPGCFLHSDRSYKKFFHTLFLKNHVADHRHDKDWNRDGYNPYFNPETKYIRGRNTFEFVIITAKPLAMICVNGVTIKWNHPGFCDRHTIDHSEYRSDAKNDQDTDKYISTNNKGTNNAPGIVAAVSTAGIDKSMPPMIKINVIPKHNIPTVVSCSKH